MVYLSFKFYIFNLIFFYFLINICDSSENCFRAAVYEHIRIDDPLDDLFKVLKNNYEVYEKITKRASFENTKIIVFPENGLVFNHNKSKVLNEGIASYIPELNTNPCEIYTKKLKEITSNHHSDIYIDEKLEKLNQETFQENDLVKVNSELIRKFSCLASEHKIYIAVNLIEVDKQINKEVNLDEANKSKNQFIYQLEKFNEQALSTKFNDPLDTLKLNDQIINDKLNNQLLKLNENKKSDADLSLDKYSLYNTDVVFDSDGKIVAKYRKYHLFGDYIFNKTENPEFIYFDTNYGRFGIIICADILFEQPLKTLVEEKKINHLIFSTNWFDELPLLTGLGFHSAVAAKYQINILSANLRNFKNGTFGSGIYNGKTGVVIQTNFDNHNRLLIADLALQKDDKKTFINLEDNSSIDTYKYSNVDSIDYTCNHFEALRVAEETYNQFSYFFKHNTFLDDYVSLQNSLDKFKYKRIETTEGKIENVCDGYVCCELEWKMNDKFNFASDNYYLVALNRLRKSYVPWYEESCALVSYYQFKPECKLVSSTHFDKLILRGKFNTTQVYPNVLSSALVLVPKKNWSFKKNENEFELSFNDVKRTINSVFLYGINNEKTPKK